MPCLTKVHLTVLGNYRHAGDEVQGYLGLGHYEVNLAEISRRIEEVRDVRPEEIREFHEDAHYLPLLREPELLYLVVKLDYLGRLDERCLSCRGLVVDESRDPLLVGCADRDEHLSVAYRNTCVAVHDTFLLRFLEDGAHPARYGSLLLAKRLAYVVELVRSGVLDVAVAVEDQVYPALYLGEAEDVRAHALEVRVYSVLDAVEE